MYNSEKRKANMHENKKQTSMRNQKHQTNNHDLPGKHQ